MSGTIPVSPGCRWRYGSRIWAYVVDALLSLPVIPWVIKKAFLRVAMRDRLPDEIIRRFKTNLSVQPFPAVIGARQEDLVRALGAMPWLEPYINLDRLARDPAPVGIVPSWTFPAGVSLASLGNWLRLVETEGLNRS